MPGILVGVSIVLLGKAGSRIPAHHAYENPYIGGTPTSNLRQAKTHWLGALPILICTHHFWFLGIPRGRVELDVLARLHKKNLLSHPEARCNGPDSPCVCLRMKTDMKWEDV